MLSQTNIYKQRYLKYKTKYVDLQYKLNNLYGGNLATSTNSFFNKMFNKETNKIIYTLFQNDAYLMRELKENEIELPIITETSVSELKQNPVLNKIFKIIVKDIDEKIMDDYLKIYLTGNLGNPNSIKNTGHYKDAYEKVKKLRNNRFQVPATFNSLLELQNYIESNAYNLDLIDAKKAENKIKESKFTKQKEEGENDVKIILYTPKVKIYQPTSEAGSKYYGRNTKWCTASNCNNMFIHYNINTKPLYIIIPQSDQKNKFQLQIESDQLMNALDEPVTIQYISELLNDKEFDYWINEQLYKTIRIVNRELIINKFIPIFKEEHNSLIRQLIFSMVFNQPLGNSLDKLTNLQQLTFGFFFNQPLGNSLDKLTNLQQLIFENNNQFNQPLGNSLDKLINLQQLTFGSNFNQPLGNSLDKLINLQQLTFGSNFNQLLGNSLDKLINLQQLTVKSYYQHPLPQKENLKILKA